MEPDRERAYNGAQRRPAQNLSAGYRSRWAVNTAGRRGPERPGTSPVAALLAPVPTGCTRERRPIDLGPLTRLAQESSWGRLFNRPRRYPAEL